jgi:tRNA(Ile)-lysidine synthase
MFAEFDRSRPVVVGVSGGADSLCLLGMLKEAGFRVEAAHLNHQLRLEAKSDEDHARRIATDIGVSFTAESVDVSGFANEHGLSIEEAARKCRYQFLFKTARNMKAQAVVVAHTADDQVETILMHLLRGTGLSGLKGMLPLSLLPEFDGEIPLIRPILHLWRIDTESYCHQNKLEFVVDASNVDQTYFRNKLRHSLIPDLETYNPQFKKALNRMSISLQDDHEMLSSLIDRAWGDAVVEQGQGFIAFSSVVLEKSTAGMRRNLFKRTMQKLRPGLRDVDFDVLDLAARSISGKTYAQGVSPSRMLDLTGGLYLFKEEDRTYITQNEADLPSGNWPQIKDRLPVQSGITAMGSGWQLVIDSVSGDNLLSAAEANDDPFAAWLDADKATGNLYIRSTQRGDVFQPLGMNGQSVKLSDLFINIKLPKRARAKWPLFMVDNQIAWVMGLRLTHPFRLEATTRQAFRIHLKRLP